MTEPDSSHQNGLIQPNNIGDTFYPLLMAVINCTPDSFSDGGHYLRADDAIEHARRLIAEGADIVDIGGESTRPGSESVAAAEQIRRVIPVVEQLRAEWSGPISIDTTSAEVATAALDAGATGVNDTSAMRDDPDMARLVAERSVPVILMHRRGQPRTMQTAPYYENVILEISNFFEERIAHAVASGIAHRNVIIDPGIGFGKRLEDNLAILRYLGEFLRLQCPILIGASRKSFLGKLTDSPVEDRMTESVAAAIMAALNGASIVRCHDIAATKRGLKVALAIKNGKPAHAPESRQ